MPLEKIVDRVYSVGAQHADRQLFDAFMPLHSGTTYNSYYVEGSEKNALIDPVEPEKLSQLLHALEELGVKKLDYIINLHTEQDHSGGTAVLMDRYPGVQLVGTAKVAELASTHLRLSKDLYQIVKDGEELSLGDRTLCFKSIPFAHWPDNTMVHLKEEKILFSSDLFGSHLASGSIWNRNTAKQLREAKAYYSEIMMPFRLQCKKYTAWTKALDLKYIAPSHGPLWKNPEDILEAYSDWTLDMPKSGKVVIAYVSMHESTAEMVQEMVLELNRLDMPYSLHNLGANPSSLSFAVGEMAADLVDSSALIFASPTVLTNPHPACQYAGVVADTLKPRLRYLGFMGSYGWATKAAERMKAITPQLKGEWLDPLMVEGYPTEEDKERIRVYTRDLVQRIQEARARDAAKLEQQA